MTVNDLIANILGQVWNFSLPFGFSFGIFCLMLGSLPLVKKLITKIF